MLLLLGEHERGDCGDWAVVELLQLEVAELLIALLPDSAPFSDWLGLEPDRGGVTSAAEEGERDCGPKLGGVAVVLRGGKGPGPNIGGG